MAPMIRLPCLEIVRVDTALGCLRLSTMPGSPGSALEGECVGV